MIRITLSQGLLKSNLFLKSFGCIKLVFLILIHTTFEDQNMKLKILQSTLNVYKVEKRGGWRKDYNISHVGSCG